MAAQANNRHKSLQSPFNMKVTVFALLAVLAVTRAELKRHEDYIPRMPMVTPKPGATPPLNFKPHKSNVQKSSIHEKGKAVPGCGVASVLASPLIVNGQEAVAHSYPWQVALYIDDLYFCGGSLISEKWVLTAGHCTTGSLSIRVVMGAHNLSYVEPTQQEQTSTNITTHEDYGSLLLHNDVGLVQLPLPVVFDDYIKPICLPSYSDADIGADVNLTASGWGKTKDGLGGISDTLNEVTNPSITNEDCSATYGIVTNATICTDTSTGKKGTCNGDSGGPLMLVVGGTTYSRGVTSFVSSNGCASGDPDGFTRTTHYLDWIAANTGIAIDP